MSILSGENGAVYYNAELSDTGTANSIAYSTTGVYYFITSSTDDGAAAEGVIDFETRGYKATMLFALSGASTGNNKIFTISAVSSGVLTVEEAVADGTDTGTPRFTEVEPGVEVGGFYNWTLSYTGDALETTNFNDSSGGRSYIPGMTSWTATADKYFLTVDNEIDDWIGQTCEIRLFVKYVATPTTGDVALYWDGDTVVTSFDHTTPVDTVVSQSISFQGDGPLTLVSKTADWNTTG